MGNFSMSELTGAIFSSDRRYRYALWRVWDINGPRVAFIMLNPSIADEVKDDPTQRRCRRFSKDWGFGGYTVGNLFAYVSTDPKALNIISDPIGPENNLHLWQIYQSHDLTIVAWGKWGYLLGRGNEVMRMLQGFEDSKGNLKGLWCLGQNLDGTPKHPLYLKASTQPKLLEMEA